MVPPPVPVTALGSQGSLVGLLQVGQDELHDVASARGWRQDTGARLFVRVGERSEAGEAGSYLGQRQGPRPARVWMQVEAGSCLGRRQGPRSVQV